ncbi:MAG: FAD:protein FMN transferase [Flavobacteriales bacterium]|nr:FAD:protein FMN transferase [Flavobacteriales bacterium]
MGSSFTITVVDEDSVSANQHIHTAIQEIKRIEKVISSWDAKSETSRINQNAGIQPVQVSEELYRLIERCIAISKLTDGAFDITYASMDKIWKFDGSMTAMPDETTIEASVAKVGFQHIELNEQEHAVFLTQKGMKIGFGGIGKGYAADQAKALLIAAGVEAGIINASGDMNTWGEQPNGKDWEVGITNPFDKQKVYGTFPIHNNAVVTSGNYEKYVEFNGKRYTHIIDPRTGYPATGIISATVFAPKAELADALATSVFVMGIEVGLDRINQLPEIECILIDEQGKIHCSRGIQLTNL